MPFSRQEPKYHDRPGQRHSIVGRIGIVSIKIPSLDSLGTPDLDESAGTPGIFSLPPIAQTALVKMDDSDAAHSIT
jgi:hypothetical protein